MPYSANAELTEYYDLSKERNGDIWFVVTTIVDDPQYLTRTVRHQHEFQERVGREQVQSHALLGALIWS